MHKGLLKEHGYLRKIFKQLFEIFQASPGLRVLSKNENVSLPNVCDANSICGLCVSFSQKFILNLTHMLKFQKGHN